MYLQKSHHTVKSIRQRETISFKCSYVDSNSLYELSPKVLQPNKTQEQLVRNSGFGWVLLGTFLFRKYPSLSRSFALANKTRDKNSRLR